MYKNITPLKVSSNVQGNTNKEILDNIVSRLGNVNEETTYKELTDINKYIDANKFELSKEEYNTMKDYYKSSKQVWKDINNEKKYQLELEKQARLGTKQIDYWRKQVAKIEKMEQNILKAKDKVKARKEWERARERAIEQIWEEFGVDAETAYDMYQSFI